MLEQFQVNKVINIFRNFNRPFKILFFVLFIVLLYIFSTNIVTAQSVDDFFIESFTAKYYLSNNDKNIATLDVEENLIPNFINKDINHGIIRAIPEEYSGESLGLKIQSVTDANNQPIKYSTSRKNNNLVLKIGDPNVYINGEYEYKIKYQMTNVVRFYDNHDEFFWNVNGTEWRQPINRISVSLKIDPQINLQRKSEIRCYTGSLGSKDSNCEIVGINQDYSEINVNSSNLESGENLSIVTGFNKGTFSPDVNSRSIKKIVNILSLIILISAPILTLISMVIVWRNNGRDETELGTIIPQYEPPSGFSPVAADSLLKDKFDKKSLTANIIELAVNRYININALQSDNVKDTEFELEILSLANSSIKLDSLNDELLKALFSNNLQPGHKINLKSLNNKLYKSIPLFNKSIFSDLTNQGYYRINPEEYRKRYILFGVLLIIFATPLIFLLSISNTFKPLIGSLFAASIISGIIIIIFSRYMPAKTKKGQDMKAYILGLKEYIKMAEVDRIKFHQNPEAAIKYGEYKDKKVKVKLYEQLLPYAIIFGLENEWSEYFTDIYDSPPEWYGNNSSSFNSIYLANSISNFSNQSDTSFSAPASSSSSGFSGGGSGGGGGGGGGGGW